MPPSIANVKVESIPSADGFSAAEQHLLSAIASAGMRDALLGESDDFDLMSGSKLLTTPDHGLSDGKHLIFTVFFVFYPFSNQSSNVLGNRELKMALF